MDKSSGQEKKLRLFETQKATLDAFLERGAISKAQYDKSFGDMAKKMGMDIPATEVVAALIWRGERFMACQRPAHKARGLLWEFVGGKVEKGETKEEALIRECREELDVTLEVGDVFTEVTHEYPDLTVHLTLFNAILAQGEPKMLEHVDIRWITADEIDSLEFCPADKTILEKIKSEKGVSL